MILTKGDYMADLADKEKLGLCCVEKNYEKLCNKIIQLVEDSEFYERCKKNIKIKKDEYRWELCIKPLLSFCQNPFIAEDKKNKANILYKTRNKNFLKYIYIRVVYKLKKIIVNNWN